MPLLIQLFFLCLISPVSVESKHALAHLGPPGIFHEPIKPLNQVEDASLDQDDERVVDISKHLVHNTHSAPTNFDSILSTLRADLHDLSLEAFRRQGRTDLASPGLTDPSRNRWGKFKDWWNNLHPGVKIVIGTGIAVTAVVGAAVFPPLGLAVSGAGIAWGMFGLAMTAMQSVCPTNAPACVTRGQYWTGVITGAFFLGIGILTFGAVPWDQTFMQPITDLIGKAVVDSGQMYDNEATKLGVGELANFLGLAPDTWDLVTLQEAINDPNNAQKMQSQLKSCDIQIRFPPDGGFEWCATQMHCDETLACDPKCTLAERAAAGWVAGFEYDSADGTTHVIQSIEGLSDEDMQKFTDHVMHTQSLQNMLMNDNDLN